MSSRIQLPFAWSVLPCTLWCFASYSHLLRSSFVGVLKCCNAGCSRACTYAVPSCQVTVQLHSNEKFPEEWDANTLKIPHIFMFHKKNCGWKKWLCLQGVLCPLGLACGLIPVNCEVPSSQCTAYPTCRPGSPPTTPTPGSTALH